MSRTTVVKLTGVGHHHPGPLNDPPLEPSSVAGRAIRIHLPPIRPRTHWTCGAQMVWRIADDDVRAILGYFDGPRYACEHQLELD